MKTCFIIFFFFFSLTTHSQYESHYCSTTGNYSRESLYRADLNTLLASLSSNIPDYGFHSDAVGAANAAALCRPDIQPSTCRGCVKIAADDILVQCPDQLEAIIWYEYCMVRYSDESIAGKLATDPVQELVNSVNNLSIPAARAALMDDLRSRAAGGGPLVKAAAGNMTAAGSDQTVFGLAQCTPDLSPENCTRCLSAAAGLIPGCCDGAAGARVYMPSCNIRYELGSFYNVTRLQQLIVASASPPRPPLSPPTAGNGGDNKIRNVVIIVVSVVAFLTLALFVGFFLRKRKKHETTEDPKISGTAPNSTSLRGPCVEIHTVESIQYEFHEIEAATNNFSDANALGRGGFGIVYKGKLENGKEIAVKRLLRDLGQGEGEFKNEVLLVARLQHRNLVRLLGFSIQGNERLLIYEFVPNGSLDHFLFDGGNSSSTTLDWDMRYKIIGGVVRGLLYLHEDSRLRIIHRDLKASNVLLDEKMSPKISDFGLAKLVLPGATQVSASRIVGTYGYMAPEYAMVGRFSIKSDIYSFGVLLLEIMTGQRRMIQNGNTAAGDLLSYAWRNWREGTSAKIIDPILMAASEANPDMLKCIHIALLCVQENPYDRPTAASVVQMLNSSPSLTLPSPSESKNYVISLDSRSSISHDQMCSSDACPLEVT